ncbi:MAG: ATP-dependent zinc metalloprotease FtsH [Deltaproteobacteria bacterium]|nr:ATP-dependent zinc metalloprotease FtsH [Candidatus Tharpella sp.]
MKPFYKNLALWLVICLIMIMVFNVFNNPGGVTKHEISFSEFIEMIDSGQISEVTIQGQNISGTYGSTAFKTYTPDDPTLIKMLRDKGIRITAKPEDQSPLWQSILISWFPMLLLIGVWVFFMRQMQGGGGKAMSFGKSRAKLLNADQKKVTFKDVSGIEEAKVELEEIINFLKEPKRFTRLGGKIPKGVLLVGAPGTGKTLLAKAIAGEAEVPFFSISGSDFVEMFVGVGASRVRDLFIQGKKNAPCLIFIDEIDAVGRHRGAGLGGGHDEREQTLNQLLVEMDGFESNDGVILLAATNRPDVLDPALLRPGRFDRQVIVPNPDVKGREGILKVHARKVPLAKDVDLSVVSRGTPGFTGADLANLINEASLLAARTDKKEVEMIDLEEAKDKVMMGAERRSLVISPEEKNNTAYHEAGHALIARLLPGTDPIHKVTIIPRGRALGLTQQLPIDERHTYNKEYLINNIIVLMGGRVAEELALNHITTGAGNDIERATEMARKMVCEWGMGHMGPVSFGKKEEHIFLGREMAQNRDFSEKTAIEIDDEIKEIVNAAYAEALKLVGNNRKSLDSLALALLEKESLNGTEVDKLIGILPADEKSDAEVQAVNKKSDDDETVK